MSVCRLQFLTSITFYSFSFSPKPTKSHLKCNSRQNPVHGGLICASSAEKPKKKKGRLTRATMSNDDLCNELREVMFVAGLSADRVPLIKELSEHGRKDLANIVRRRGYKAVWELLRTFNLCDNHSDTISGLGQELGNLHGDEASEIEETHITDPAESILFSGGSSEMEEYTAGINVSGANREDPAKKEPLPDRDWGDNQENNTETSDYLVVEDNSKTDIDLLKSLLCQKEVELSELKQLIEKEKQTLTKLQARAQNEIGNVHRVRSSKDAELRAAEDRLSGLREVQIQYRADGETVEVAGSFNGWYKQLKMDLLPSSKTVDLQDSSSREYKSWSTILWLHPGTYEIKFIVDGQWRIDPLREVSTNGHITNNVLRVDR